MSDAPKRTYKPVDALKPYQLRQEQLLLCRQMLAEGKRTWQINQALQEQYGLSPASCTRRLKEARLAIVNDLQAISRQEMAAQIIETATALLEDAKGSKQISNGIGCLRLIAELSGLSQQK